MVDVCICVVTFDIERTKKIIKPFYETYQKICGKKQFT